MFVWVLTYVDGPYLQAWLFADVAKRILTVVTHHSAELKKTHMLDKKLRSSINF